MFSRPEELSDDDVARGLNDGWFLDGVRLEYAPVGFGSYHWQVGTRGAKWFATADDLWARRTDDTEPTAAVRHRLTAALSAARSLRDAGLGFVVAPVPTASGEMLHRLSERYVLALYPFVAGRTHSWGAYRDRDERVAVLRRLATLHGVDRGAHEDAAEDDFALPGLGALRSAAADLRTRWEGGPFAEPARALLARYVGPLEQALDRYAGLVTSVRDNGAGLVVTHGEPHRGNTIATDTGVVLIDWDTLLVAPPERDLWALHQEDPEVLDVYRALTGRSVDADTLHLYRLRWDLTEVCLSVTQFRGPHGRSEDTEEAWNLLRHHLDPARW
ncbi:MAG: phosphotransferase [Kineosporiaceae bacterium]